MGSPVTWSYIASLGTWVAVAARFPTWASMASFTFEFSSGWTVTSWPMEQS